MINNLLIQKDIYSITKFCKLLGENPTTFKNNKTAFLDHFNMFFDCEFIAKKKGGNILLQEDFETENYIKYKVAKKQANDRIYLDVIEKQLKKNPYSTGAAMIRDNKMQFARINHSFKYSCNYINRVMKNNGYVRHYNDTIWTNPQEGGRSLDKEEYEFLMKCLIGELDKKKEEVIKMIGLIANKDFNKDTLKYCENSVVIQLYNDGINKFKEKYCFRPIVAPRIDKVPLTKEEEEIVSARALKREMNKMNVQKEKPKIIESQISQNAFAF